MPLHNDLEAMRAKIADLEAALTVARQTADIEHKAAEAARESARRAWAVSSAFRVRTSGDE